jgi:hypothetical protein
MKTTNNEVKGYKAKSSAIRAAKKHGLNPEAEQIDGLWFIVMPAIEAPDAKPSWFHKSEVGSPCRYVWNIAEQMWGARRKDIIQACVDSGIAYATARTQYQSFYKAKMASLAPSS